jgi:multidrug efflux pump subunit AcrA (membrane-fusion protein)
VKHQERERRLAAEKARQQEVERQRKAAQESRAREAGEARQNAEGAKAQAQTEWWRRSKNWVWPATVVAVPVVLSGRIGHGEIRSHQTCEHAALIHGGK